MDLAETMKQVLSNKGSAAAVNSLNTLQQLQQQQQQQQQQLNNSNTMHSLHQQNDGSSGSGASGTSSTGVPGAGYVTEKLYMLLQLYLQNKGWNPSVELLQCFSELKDSALLPSAAYLQ